MRFFEIVVSGAALISAAMAQLAINDYPQNGVRAGQTYTITYSPKDQTPTQIILRQGPSTNLNTVATLGTATGGSFTWTVPSNLPSGSDYAIEVRQGSVNNYSGQFGLTGGSASAAVSSVLASASSVLASVSSAQASASSVIASLSSKVASVTSAASSASASASMSAGTNSTISSATLSRTASGSAATASRTASTSGGPPQSTGAASSLESSPLALVFGAAAAFFYLA